MKEYAKMK